MKGSLGFGVQGLLHSLGSFRVQGSGVLDDGPLGDQWSDVHNFCFDLVVDPSDLGRLFRVVPFVALWWPAPAMSEVGTSGL